MKKTPDPASPPLPPPNNLPRRSDGRADRVSIYACAGLRACAVGFSGIVLALHLATIGFDPGTIGLAVSLGLLGCALGTGAAAFLADHLGGRRTLIALSALMALGAAAFILTTRLSVLLAGAVLGMVNGMGRDRGAGVTVEQAMLPRTTAASNRTAVFAWYNVVVDAGHAAGSLLGGLPAWLRIHAHAAPLSSYQWSWGLYVVLCVAAGGFALRISPSVELAGRVPVTRLSPSSRAHVARFAALSGLDSFAGGFLTTALISYWFFRRFGVDESLLGPLFFVVRIANGLSHLGAAWLARRIGLVNTMVFTHLPSSLLLMTVPFAPTLPIAIFLFLARESLVEMDVPTRQSYLVAIVRDEERMRASGIANLARTTGWAAAPMIAGSLMRTLSLSAPLIVGPGLKIAYDLLLYRAFRHLKPPEER